MRACGCFISSCWFIVVCLLCAFKRDSADTCFSSIGHGRTVANMFSRATLGFALSISAACVGAALSAESRGSAADAQYTLNLHPPTEDPLSVQSSLDVIMSAANAQRQRDDDAFSSEKQAMLDAEKRQIHDIIQSSFARYDSSL